VIARLQTTNGDQVKDVELNAVKIYGEDAPKVKHQSPPDGLIFEKRAYFFRYKDEGVAIYREGLLYTVPGK
jgi:hypothetical protein